MIAGVKRKEFGAKVVEYADGKKSLNGPSMKLLKRLNGYDDLAESGIFDGYEVDKKKSQLFHKIYRALTKEYFIM